MSNVRRAFRWTQVTLPPNQPKVRKRVSTVKAIIQKGDCFAGKHLFDRSEVNAMLYVN
ncbi:MAG TPA: hypothetical protein VLL54_18460 [Pyrinomonadaceae bacterium]|nr:hypothetical protein [Pyrinomonadaceae bacterium]